MRKHAPNTVDVLRLGKAVRHAGIDPRVWTTAGRISTEGEAVRWDADLGYVVDVVAYGGNLTGKTLVCRVATNSEGHFIPLSKDDDVMVAVPEGDTNLLPTIVGVMNNADGNEAPGDIHGLEIDGSVDDTTASFDAEAGSVAPYDTEIKYTPHNLREEFGGYYFVKASDCVLEGDNVRFSKRTADQSFIRGDRFTEVLGPYLDAMASYISAAATANAKVYGAINLLAPATVTPDEIAAVADAAVSVPLRQTDYNSSVSTPGDSLSDSIKGD